MSDSRKILVALRLAALFGGLAQSVSGSAAALLARDLGGSDAVAGLPQALVVAGSAVAALGISALTRRHGRGPALAAGAGAAAAGAALVAGAATAGSLSGVLAGCLLLGSGTTAVMLGRYAAADTAPPAARARAMGSVLVATTVGAVLGPNLLAPADVLGRALDLRPLAGAFVVAVVCFAAAAGLLMWRVPGVIIATRTAGSPGPGRAAVPGLAVLAPTNLVMVAVMTMAPVHLHHIGLGLGPIGLVISAHILGMFAPSPLSGWLTDRVGAARAGAVAGVVLTAAALLAALGAATPAVLGAALALLGVGWNLGLITGSTLLTAGVPEAQRPRREGWGEVGMGVAAAAGGAVSGVVAGSAGYPVLAAGSALVAALVVVAAWRARALPATDAAQRVA